MTAMVKAEGVDGGGGGSRGCDGDCQ
jgi:hypothetical protein